MIDSKIVYTAIIRFLAVIFSVASTIILIRILGQKTFGEFTTLLSICFLSLSLFAMPMQVIVLRDLFSVRMSLPKYSKLQHVLPMLSTVVLTLFLTYWVEALPRQMNVTFFLMMSTICLYYNFLGATYLRGFNRIYVSQLIELSSRYVIPLILIVTLFLYNFNNFDLYYRLLISLIPLVFLSLLTFHIVRQDKIKIENEINRSINLGSFCKIQLTQVSQIGISHIDTIFVATFIGVADAAVYKVVLTLTALLNNNESIISYVINEKIQRYYDKNVLKEKLKSFRAIILVFLVVQLFIFLLFGKWVITHVLNIPSDSYQLCISVFFLQIIKDFFSLNKTSALMLSRDKLISQAALLRIATHIIGLSFILNFSLNVHSLILNYYFAMIIEVIYLQQVVKT